jgi:tRNA threonylcarbamoyladenosine biosynthesis protein TsaE
MEIKRGGSFRAISKSSDETRLIGRSLGSLLINGDAVYIYGDVGAGKTVFVSGIARAFDIGAHITSPTFTVMNYYRGETPLCHYDAYRIKSPAEIIETGFFEFLGGDCVVAVEWAERLSDLKPDKCVEVWIERIDGCDEGRAIKIEFN